MAGNSFRKVTFTGDMRGETPIAFFKSARYEEFMRSSGLGFTSKIAIIETDKGLEAFEYTAETTRLTAATTDEDAREKAHGNNTDAKLEWRGPLKELAYYGAIYDCPPALYQAAGLGDTPPKPPADRPAYDLAL